jgi:hypothetical protein
MIAEERMLVPEMRVWKKNPNPRVWLGFESTFKKSKRLAAN